MNPERQDGYVVAQTALLIIPLMIFAALAVDVGAWYRRAQQIQVGADSAALAGVPMLPDFAAAKALALETAARNGFVDQPGCDGAVADCVPASFPQVVVTRVGTNRIEVTIFSSASVYLGRVVMSDDIAVTRYATAEVTPPVPLGNPTSVLGGGAEDVVGSTPNFWLRAMPECEPRSTGDFIGSAGACIGNPNPNHRPEGHTFIVDVPVAGLHRIQARLTCAEFDGSQANASMRFRLYDRDNTPYDDDDNVLQPPIAERVIPRPDPAICPIDGSGWAPGADPAPWVTISTVAEAGRFVLEAKNPDFTAARRSLYSLRVVPDISTAACSRVGPSGSSGCPTILAKEYLTSYTHAQMFSGNTVGQSQVYLAEISESLAGNTMQIDLFDPADGLDEMRIVDPHGNYANLSWYTIDCRDYSYDCGRGDIGSPTNLRSQSCGGDSCLKQESGVSFQDRTVRVLIDLPGNYQCAEPANEPANCWWKVEYRDSDTDANETITWSVRVLGDPIRLIE